MITIRHTPAEGTLIEGSRKGDGAWEALAALRMQGQGNWRYSRDIGLYLGQSRDQPAQKWKIDKAAAALRAAGHEVEIVIDDSATRTFAEAEQDRYDRADARAGYHYGVADKAARASDARFGAERRILGGIPPGQPILVGHHSEGRHRRDLARAEGHMRAGMAEAERSDYHAGRAAAAESYQAGREDLPTTLRRIKKLEAERRQADRRLNGTGKAMHGEDEPATGAWRDQLTSQISSMDEQLAYWRAHVARLKEAGAKVWGPGDFKKGDFARYRGRWLEVVRVNRKSVTVPAIISDGLVVTREGSRLSWTDTLPYDQLSGRAGNAEEATARLAAAGREAGGA
jgi:hypothetical protein